MQVHLTNCPTWTLALFEFSDPYKVRQSGVAFETEAVLQSPTGSGPISHDGRWVKGEAINRKAERVVSILFEAFWFMYSITGGAEGRAQRPAAVT